MKRIALVLSVLLIFTSCTTMKRVFIKEKSELIEKNKIHQTEIFTEESIKELPEPLKNTFGFADILIDRFLLMLMCIGVRVG